MQRRPSGNTARGVHIRAFADKEYNHVLFAVKRGVKQWCPVIIVLDIYIRAFLQMSFHVGNVAFGRRLVYSFISQPIATGETHHNQHYPYG
jgi:hypothetical protein